MKSAVIFCSKSGNTKKVAQAIADGLEGEVDLIYLNLTPEGIMKEWSNTFTLDLAGYDSVFLGGWATLMKIHPYLVAYIKKCKNIEDRKVYGFITAGGISSVGHVRENLEKILRARNIRMLDFFYATTLLGPALTKRKLEKARAFGCRVSREIKRLAKDMGT